MTEEELTSVRDRNAKGINWYADVSDLLKHIDGLDAEYAELEAECAETREQPWPEWADKLLRLLESWGAEYDADEEINLPDELSEWLHHYASDLKRSQAAHRPPQEASGQDGAR